MAKNDAGQRGSNEFLDLKEFFSVVVKIVGTLAGFAAVFALLGYTIILSFINRIKLYGLTSFPQEFYKEATMKFVGDMFETYGNHPYCTAIMALLIAGIAYAAVRYRQVLTDTFAGRALGFVVSVLILAAALLTLRLEIMPEKLFSIKEIKQVIIFMISVPISVGVFLYLAFRFRRFVEKPYRYYYVMAFSLLGLFISIPVGYGDNIFDIDIFPVVGFDYSDTTKIESLKTLKKDIDSQGKGALFFLMGHMTDREIFFDNQTLSPPAKMILVERNLIKFLRISRENINTLRNILMKQERIVPIDGAKGRVTIEDLPADIGNLIRKEQK
jgi:hypothetical protein